MLPDSIVQTTIISVNLVHHFLTRFILFWFLWIFWIRFHLVVNHLMYFFGAIYAFQVRFLWSYLKYFVYYIRWQFILRIFSAIIKIKKLFLYILNCTPICTPCFPYLRLIIYKIIVVDVSNKIKIFFLFLSGVHDFIFFVCWWRVKYHFCTILGIFWVRFNFFGHIFYFLI